MDGPHHRSNNVAAREESGNTFGQPESAFAPRGAHAATPAGWAEAMSALDGEADVVAPEVEAAVRPMLEAVVRIAGANAGVIRVRAGQLAHSRHETFTGLPARKERGGLDAMRFWCGRCVEGGNPDGGCAKSGARDVDEPFAGDRFGPACPYVTMIPLRSTAGPVGTLGLLFERQQVLPAGMMPLLRATGELITVAMENARLMRENLRVNVANERQTMANEVHDSLAQGLTYMRMRVSLLRDAIEQRDELRAFKYLGDIDGALTDEHHRLRELITCFRSAMDPQGLRHALQEIAGTFHDRNGIVLELCDRAPDLDLPVGREVQVFHIVQEALANIQRHANATRARVTLDKSDERYEIAIEDDGLGMAADTSADARTRTGHYGIAIMRERARRLGGELTLRSVAGVGTTVRLSFPAAQPER